MDSDPKLELLREIRDLLTLIAEPQLEERDKLRRSELRRIVGRGEKKIAATLLMNGSRTKAEIARESTIDAGDLTKLVKAFNEAKLLDARNNSSPRLVIPVSRAMFLDEKKNGR